MPERLFLLLSLLTEIGFDDAGWADGISPVAQMMSWLTNVTIRMAAMARIHILPPKEKMILLFASFEARQSVFRITPVHQIVNSNFTLFN